MLVLIIRIRTQSGLFMEKQIKSHVQVISATGQVDFSFSIGLI